jgi:hypothetical protein
MPKIQVFERRRNDYEKNTSNINDGINTYVRRDNQRRFSEDGCFAKRWSEHHKFGCCCATAMESPVTDSFYYTYCMAR